MESGITSYQTDIWIIQNTVMDAGLILTAHGIQNIRQAVGAVTAAVGGTRMMAGILQMAGSG